MPMLTARQVISVITRSSIPPWHFSALRHKDGTRLSLRDTINAISPKKLICFIRLADPTLLNVVNNVSDLRAKFATATPSKATIDRLSQLLTSAGASIKYISQDWRVLGISGTVASFAGVPVTLLDNNTIAGAKDVATGAIAIGGVIAVAAITTPPAAPVLYYFYVSGLGLGFAGGGLYLGAGLGEIVNSQPSGTGNAEPTAPPSVTELPELTIYGSPPPGIPVQDLPDQGTINVHDLPDAPSDPGDVESDPGDPGGVPTGP
jgi:hypothetical protein